MTYEEWQRRRGVWMEEEKLERQSNFGAARTHIQVAITERAIRDLYDRVAALEVSWKSTFEAYERQVAASAKLPESKGK